MAAKKSTKSAAGDAGFTPEERAAMRDHLRERKAAARGEQDRAAGDADVRAKIAAMPGPDRALAERVHAIVTSAAPELVPRLWYGMPAYARTGEAGGVVCFFQDAAKFKSRYATLGFSDKARLDEGSMWPTAFALVKLGPAEEERITALVRRAVA